MSLNNKKFLLKRILLLLSIILLITFLFNYKYKDFVINSIFTHTSQFRGIIYSDNEIKLKQLSQEEIIQLLKYDTTDPTNTDLLYRAFKFIEPSETTSQILENNFHDDVKGFYSIDDKTFYISKEKPSINSSISPTEKYLLSHEFTHYLQDTKYNIRAVEQEFNLYEEANADLAKSYLALLEGDATFTALMYLNDNDVNKVENILLESYKQIEEEKLHPYIKEIAIFHYIDSPLFVLNRYKENNNFSTIDKTYETLDISSQNIITSQGSDLFTNNFGISELELEDIENQLDNKLSRVYGNYTLGVWEIRMLLSKYVDRDKVEEVLEDIEGSILALWSDEDSSQYYIYWIIEFQNTDDNFTKILDQYCMLADQNCAIQTEGQIIYIKISSK